MSLKDLLCALREACKQRILAWTSSFAEQHGGRELSAQDKETLTRHLFVDYQAQNKHFETLKKRARVRKG